MVKVVFVVLFVSGSAYAVVPATTTLNRSSFGAYVAPNGLYSSTSSYYLQVESMFNNGLGAVRWNSDMWDLIETSSGTFDWSKLDQFVNIATSTFGMDFVFILPISASWMPILGACPYARTVDYTIYGYSGSVLLPVGRTHCPASDPNVIKRFAQNFSSRYCNGDKIYAQAWNEPDYPLYWKGETNPSTQDYIDQALKPMYEGIKAGCPNMDVVLGGLFDPRGELRRQMSADGYNPLNTGYTGNFYFNELLLNGATNYFDIVDIHVYNDFVGADMATDIGIVESTYTAIIGRTPRLWVTETSTTGGLYRTSNIPLEEYRKQQWATWAFPVGFGFGAEKIFWHSWYGGGDFRALNDDYTERPVAGTIKRLINVFSGSEPVGFCSSGTLTCLEYRNVTNGLKINFLADWTIDSLRFTGLSNGFYPGLVIDFSTGTPISGKLGDPPPRTRVMDVDGAFEFLRPYNFNSYTVDSDPKIATPLPASVEFYAK